MTAAKIGLCVAEVTVGATTTSQQKMAFRSNTILYTGDFATATGISVAGSDDKTLPSIPIKSLIRGGQLTRMIAVTKGTEKTPSSQIRILVDTSKISAAMAWPDGAKSLPGSSAGPVVAIRHANRMRLS